MHLHEPYSLTASIVAGIVVPHDAMSNVVRQNANALQSLPQGCRVRIFTMHQEVQDSRCTLVSDPAALAADPFFRASDIVIFHFGIRYPLFPAIQLAPRTAKTFGFFFGVTPPHLVAKNDKDTIDESYRQMSHLHAADQIIVTADSLRTELRPVGIPDSKIVKVPLSAWVKRSANAHRITCGPGQLLYVSRFVPAKGTLDLLMAFRRAVASGVELELDLVGNLLFSDRQYLDKLQQYIREQNLGKRVRFHFDASDQQLASLYSKADALVSPSYHEGFGVAIAEALQVGCFVICSDAGAQPETAGGLGITYKSGSVDQLTEKLIAFANALEDDEYPTQDGRTISRSEWRAHAAVYASTLTDDAYTDRFRRTILASVRQLPDGINKYLADSCRGMIKGYPLPNEGNGAKRVYEKLDAQMNYLQQTGGRIHRAA